jgi:hypothetical protein
MIGSLTQLQPTPARPLFLLSVQFTDAGAGPGESLTEGVRDVERLSQNERVLVVQGIATGLRSAGWQPDHGAHYRRRFRLRTPAQLIPVEGNFPAIVPDTLRHIGSGRLNRISQVAYRIDVTGLGHADGEPAFLTVLPEGERG